MTCCTRIFTYAIALAALLVAWSGAQAQQVTLRLHQFLPAPAPIPAGFLIPWIKKVEADSKGRIKIEHYPSLQLGGTPAQLYDQVKDGVVDLTWAPPGYTPGRFPRSETFELPFVAGDGENTSVAGWDFYEKNLKDEFKDVKVLAVNITAAPFFPVK